MSTPPNWRAAKDPKRRRGRMEDTIEDIQPPAPVRGSKLRTSKDPRQRRQGAQDELPSRHSNDESGVVLGAIPVRGPRADDRSTSASTVGPTSRTTRTPSTSTPMLVAHLVDDAAPPNPEVLYPTAVAREEEEPTVLSKKWVWWVMFVLFLVAVVVVVTVSAIWASSNRSDAVAPTPPTAAGDEPSSAPTPTPVAISAAQPTLTPTTNKDDVPHGAGEIASDEPSSVPTVMDSPTIAARRTAEDFMTPTVLPTSVDIMGLSDVQTSLAPAPAPPPAATSATMMRSYHRCGWSMLAMTSLLCIVLSY